MALIMRIAGMGLAVSAIISGSYAASAATVNSANGTISINSGRPLRGAVQANAGDSVTAGPGGQAEITYANGCTLTVAAGTTVLVVTEEQCALAQGGPSGTTLALGATAVAGAVGIGIAVSQNSGNKKPSSP
jgi:hypothetical protein